jgi:hypothetical protein
MTATTKPDKQLVRDVMAQRRAAHLPPPSLEEIRTQLGWRLIQAEQQQLARQG